MKRIALLSWLAVMIPMMTLQAQRIDDDMYYTPKKKTAVIVKEDSRQAVASENHVDSDEADDTRERVVEQADASPRTVVVRDRKKKVVQDEDSYNRRYSSRQYDFSQENDTLYVDEREDSDLRGEWQRDFDGTDSDYEYATRLIRFRNPRYAVAISSPLYWDIVSGAFLGYEWNVYYDDMYAYVFPTSMNRLYWDWRFNWHTPFWGWSSWYSPWYSPWYSGWSIGWYGGGWSIGWHGHFGGWGWHHPHHWGGWNHNWNVATNRPSLATRNSITTRGGVATRGQQGNNGRGVVSRSSSTRSSVSTRSSQSTASGERSQAVGTRSNSQIRRVVSSRTADENGLGSGTANGRSSYNRPSSTRSTAGTGTGRSSFTRPSSTGAAERGESYTRSSRSVSGESGRSGNSTFSRGSSTTRERSYTGGSSSTTRSYGSENSSRSFSSGSSSRSFSGGSSSFGGGGSRSFGGGGSSQRSSGGRR